MTKWRGFCPLMELLKAIFSMVSVLLSTRMKNWNSDTPLRFFCTLYRYLLFLSLFSVLFLLSFLILFAVLQDEQLSFIPSISLPSNALSFAIKRRFGPSDKLRFEIFLFLFLVFGKLIQLPAATKTLYFSSACYQIELSRTFLHSQLNMISILSFFISYFSIIHSKISINLYFLAFNVLFQ